jgi:hypothetical protein
MNNANNNLDAWKDQAQQTMMIWQGDIVENAQDKFKTIQDNVRGLMVAVKMDTDTASIQEAMSKHSEYMGAFVADGTNKIKDIALFMSTNNAF